MTQVFISYSRKDLAFVKRLAVDLENADLDVWYDMSELKGGAHWQEEIENAIRARQYVIVVLSPASVASKWVKEELLCASELGKKIIPLIYKPCATPFGYRTIQHINIQGKYYQENFKEILRALGVMPKDVPPKPGSQPIPPGFKLATYFQEFLVRTEIFFRNHILFMRVVSMLSVFILLLWGGLWTLPKIIRMIPTPKPSETLPPVTEAPSPTVLPDQITNDDGIEMILIPNGEFIMGSENGEEDEKPAHVLVLLDFYIDKFEVTNLLYKKCVDAKKCEAPKYSGSKTHSTYYGNSQFDNYPVIYVDWYMAKTYCDWRGARLPTEAEWEKAARSADGRTYPWGEGVDISYANFLDIRTDTVPVGEYSKGVSPYGVYDMGGNVWEWVSSRYMPYPYNLPDDRELMDFTDYRVKRGGSWKVGNPDLRSTNRQSGYPLSNDDDTGFRCARDATEEWKIYVDKNQGSTITVGTETRASNSIRITFNLLQGDWAAVYKKLFPKNNWAGSRGLILSYKGHGAPNTIEVKLIHTDDTVCKKVFHTKTNTNDITDHLEISYSELVCEAGTLNLNDIDRIDLSFSNWPNFGDEPGEGEVIVEKIQPIW